MSRANGKVRRRAPSIVWRKIGERPVGERLYVGDAWVVSIYDKELGKPVVVEYHWDARPDDAYVESVRDALPLPSTWDIGTHVEWRPVVHRLSDTLNADWKAMQDSEAKDRRASRHHPIVLTVLKEVVERMYLRILPADARAIEADMAAQLNRIPPEMVHVDDRDPLTGRIRVPCERSIRRSLASLDRYLVADAHMGHLHKRHEIAR